MKDVRSSDLRINDIRMNDRPMNHTRGNGDLKLLVEWSSPWEEFLTAIRPALSRSPAPLAAEAHTGLFPYRTMLASMALEMLFLVALLTLPSRLGRLKPLQASPPPTYDVIYFSGDELPKTEDFGGARTGRSGRSGGAEGHHATQVIRVARGPSLKEQVVDVPKLNLPNSNSAVANLLAYKSVPGPPPDKGLEASSRHAEMLAAAIPPPAAIQHEDFHAAPSLQAGAIAPTQNELNHQLTSRRISESGESVVPPPVSAPSEVAILHPQLTLPQSLVVAPSPSELRRQLSSRRISESRESVVPPPVSAPDEATVLHPQLTLPQSSVVGPVPSELTRELTSRRISESRESVVPPPASEPREATALHSEPGLPQSRVIPPAPSGREIREANARYRAEGLRNQAVVPPAPEAATTFTGRRVIGVNDAAVVAPASQIKGVVSAHRRAGNFGDSKVVPPPAQVEGSLMRRANGLPQASAVIQPPPSASAGTSAGVRGRHGLAGDTMAEAVVPPSPAIGNGIVISARPGSKVGSPTLGSAGSLAMSPSGGAHPGLGGTGGGAGISHGSGPGSSTSGQGSGAKTTGSGQGSNEVAHNGISPFPGTGGAGKGTTSAPALPGVSVSGGSINVLRLPSFGTDGAPIADAGHSPRLSNVEGPGITVVATSHSAGAFNFYGALKGDKVYTIYIDTTLGTAVMQFADPKTATQTYPEDLTAPQAIRAELPFGVTPSRLVISCILDRTGLVKNPRVLDAKSPELSAKVMAALPAWKFRPVLRGDQPVEVNAILGFDIDTN
ncbi:MAG: hypothetical protein ACRD2U_01420 [Terriglobales bacterium]